MRAILRIPIQKQGKYITLERNYVAAQTNDLRYDQANNRGHFLTVPFALSVFPFVRTPQANQSSVQLIDRALGMLQNYGLSLSFFKNGYQQQLSGDAVVLRERSLKSEKRVGSQYYKLADDFDYIAVTLTDERGNRAAEGMVCPR